MNRRDILKSLVSGAAGAGLGDLAACRNRRSSEAPSPSGNGREGQLVNRLVDVTEQAGIVFRHNTGAFGKKYLPETLGSGCAFFDYDTDGWLDVLLINSMDWAEHRR